MQFTVKTFVRKYSNYKTCSTRRLMMGKPSKAELSQPLVKILSKPREIRVSMATDGS